MSGVTVLGCDPSLTSFGYSVTRLSASDEEILAVGVIRTKPTAKKQRLFVADDNFRRAREIAAALKEVLAGFQPKAITAEAFSPVRNASASAKVALTWGILASLVEENRLPLIQQTPQGIKKKLCGKSSAPKSEVQEALLEKYPGQFDGFMKAYPRGQWEHGFDAAASTVVLLDSPLILAIRGMVS